MGPVVIYTLPRLNHGGAEIRSLQLFRHFRQAHPGLRIILHSTSLEPGRLDAAFRQAGATILRGRQGWRGLIDFHLHCRQHKADVAHVNMGMKSGFYVLAAFLAGVKTRIAHFRTETEDRFTWGSRARGRLGVWLMLRLATAIVGVSEAARLYPRIPARRWQTLYNGIAGENPATALAWRPRQAPGGGTLLVLGRIDQNKNNIRAVSVFEALRRQPGREGLRLRFVGTGTDKERARLQARIAASPAATGIDLYEVTDDPLPHLREASALLMLSKHEGLPGVVLEALAAGTPVVASDIPAAREIADAVAGVTLVPLDAPDASWAQAIGAAVAQDRSAAIVAAFARGPFLFEDHVAAMAALWDLERVPAVQAVMPAERQRPLAAETAPAPMPALGTVDAGMTASAELAG